MATTTAAAAAVVVVCCGHRVGDAGAALASNCPGAAPPPEARVNWH